MFIEKHETNMEEEYDGYVEKEYEEREQYVPNDDVLMVRRILEILVKEDDTTQRENIFHTRCLV